MSKMFLLFSLVIFSTACSSVYRSTIEDYLAAAPTVNLGDSKETVLAKLMPSQKELSQLDIKHPEKFKHEGKLIEVIYFRSGWQDDGITTDDEFTPYVFEDGVLKAIGWTVLGGAKTQGQSRPEINVDHPYPFYPYHRYPRY